MKRKGFTLIELMIVIAIIAIIAAIAIPGLLRSRVGANETSAIGSLKTITAGQEQFRSQVCVDQDSNGIGEYGWVTELSGANNYRFSGGSCSNAPFIPGTFNANCAQKSGYVFTIYLQSTGGVWARDYVVAGINAGETTSQANAEENFLAYAWPTTYGKSGNRVFALSAQGQIMQTANIGTGGEGGATGVAAAGIPGATAAICVGGVNFVVGGDIGSTPALLNKPWSPIG